MKSIKIGNKPVGKGHPALIIAEMACAHDGCLEDAKKLVDVAVDSNADMVQFIVFSVKDSYSPFHEAYDLICKLEFSQDQWRELINYAKQKGILISANVQDIASAKLMQELNVDMLKIHSCDALNKGLIKFVAKIKKPVLITIGALTLEEIENAINIIKSQDNENIILMYGYQNYPTRTEGLNMKFIQTLQVKFQLPIGYADHTDGASNLSTIIPIASILLGANAIEKHFILDRSKQGTDYQSSSDPDVFKEFISNIRKVEEAIGDGKFEGLTKDQLKYRQIAKSIVAKQPIEKGQTITKEIITFMESVPGISPSKIDQVLNKKATRDIKQFENIVLENLE